MSATRAAPGTDVRRAGAVEAYEVELDLPSPAGRPDPIGDLRAALGERLEAGLVPIRLAVTRSDAAACRAELGVVAGLDDAARRRAGSILDLRRRGPEDASRFTTVFVVPTGIGATVGGHAGDATPAAQLLAAVSDVLVTHPNVVNASDVNELPGNALYVEGSVLARLLMGTVALAPVRSNRVLVVADAHPARSSPGTPSTRSRRRARPSASTAR